MSNNEDGLNEPEQYVAILETVAFQMELHLNISKLGRHSGRPG
jgi:hypothetical protein